MKTPVNDVGAHMCRSWSRGDQRNREFPTASAMTAMQTVTLMPHTIGDVIRGSAATHQLPQRQDRKPGATHSTRPCGRDGGW